MIYGRAQINEEENEEQTFVKGWVFLYPVPRYPITGSSIRWVALGMTA